jgi:hypothetical protein
MGFSFGIEIITTTNKKTDSSYGWFLVDAYSRKGSKESYPEYISKPKVVRF